MNSPELLPRRGHFVPTIIHRAPHWLSIAHTQDTRKDDLKGPGSVFFFRKQISMEQSRRSDGMTFETSILTNNFVYLS